MSEEVFRPEEWFPKDEVTGETCPRCPHCGWMDLEWWEEKGLNEGDAPVKYKCHKCHTAFETTAYVEVMFDSKISEDEQ